MTTPPAPPSVTVSDDDFRLQCIPVEVEWEQYFYTPVVAPYADLGGYPVYSKSTEKRKCSFNVFVQGNLELLQKQQEAQDENAEILLTVHDIGHNHRAFVRFVNHPSMATILNRAVFLHVCVPGQEPDAQEFEGEFPTVDQLGDAIAQVLSKLNVKKCVAVGEGAGADIVCRFAMNYPEFVRGLVLIHCTSTTHGIMEHIKEILTSLRLSEGHMNHSDWNYLLTHRFGNHQINEIQKHYLERIKADGINEKNLSRYIYSFAHRDDFTDQLKSRLSNVDALLVTGENSSHNKNVEHMFDNMVKAKTGFLIAHGIVDVLEEAHDYLTSALMLLCQRVGMFGGLKLPITKRLTTHDSFSCLEAMTAAENQEDASLMKTSKTNNDESAHTTSNVEQKKLNE